MQLQVALRLFRDMGRVVIEQQTNLGLWWIAGVELVQELDEVSAVVSIAHGLDDMASVADPSRQAKTRFRVVCIRSRGGGLGIGGVRGACPASWAPVPECLASRR